MRSTIPFAAVMAGVKAGKSDREIATELGVRIEQVCRRRHFWGLPAGRIEPRRVATLKAMATMAGRELTPNTDVRLTPRCPWPAGLRFEDDPRAIRPEGRLAMPRPCVGGLSEANC